MGSDNVTFIGLPSVCHSVEEALGAAGKANLENAIVLSMMADGSLAYITTNMTLAEANFIADRFKQLLLSPENFRRMGHGDAA